MSTWAQYPQFLGSAHFLMGNYETAALISRERLVLMPGTDIGRAWLAASLGHLGEAEEARAIWEDPMKMDLGFDIKTHLARFDYQRPEDPAAVIAGLSKAGIVDT
jgi:adenylate cyclase